MDINMMCMNSKCKYCWEDNCTRNINEERIEIDESGKCETFEEGESEWYQAENEYIGLTIEGKQVLVGSLLKDDENFEWVVMPKNEKGQYEIYCYDLMAVEPVYPRILKCKVIS